MLVLRELATGLASTFGSVSELAWQDDGTMLAMAITVEGGVGNGVQLFDSIGPWQPKPALLSRDGLPRRIAATSDNADELPDVQVWHPNDPVVYWTVDLAPGGAGLQPARPVNITAAVNTSFVDRESDATVEQKPSFGLAGWSRDDRSVLLYDKFDIWEVNAAGAGATRLTSGAAEHVRHRYVRLDPDEEFIDRSSPMLVSQFGLRSKKSGYAHVGTDSAAPAVSSRVWLDKRVDRLVKAKKADRGAYVVQAFDDSPDYFVADALLGQPTQVTGTNPFMRDYAWGRATTISYRSRQGVELQGSLFYPAGYEAGKKYPMVSRLSTVWSPLSSTWRRWASSIRRRSASSDTPGAASTAYISPPIPRSSPQPWPERRSRTW
jgi:dipeptidyl aminopeptidase/acylaminoacyl peptidase